ncbi:Sec-independent protein translocase protein TatC [Planctomycetes bacterium Pan216]|uniref:Sec-independent protein translocase protein TatC n=1 Tax=Kolteria novifilia TaxID=2527975 RepID=A0A518B6X5_9BACT|nr:Sec-independent protein translocase protein TatC [Planctomycetes bacterium Pan216]
MADHADDGSMTFGEHIEELRTHILRALAGIILAMIATLPMGHYIVVLLAEPVVEGQKEWTERVVPARIAKYVEEQQSLPTDKQDRVSFAATISPESLSEVTGTLDPEADVKIPEGGMTLNVTAPARELVVGLVMPLYEVQEPWNLKTLSAQEGVFIYFKASIGGAIVLASPWVFFQFYSFIAVGLYAHERRLVHMSLPFTIGLFLVGVLFCYFAMFPIMLTFFLGANSWMDLQPDIRLSEWVGFCVWSMILFGIAFQLPLAMLILERVGIFTYDQMKEKRKFAILGIFIVSALVTPMDPVSQILLAIPLCLLYEAGLILIRYLQSTNPFRSTDDDRFDDEFF